MSNLESNKLLASIYIACLVIFITSFMIDSLYKPEKVESNGYVIEVNEVKTSASKDEPVIDFNLMLANANIEKGKVVSRKCGTCHTFEKGGANKIGPNLWGIVNNKRAHMDSFKYSSALVKKGGEWTVNSLVNFLHNPGKYLSGTKMSFIGLKKPEDLVNMIAYLNTMSDNQHDLTKVDKIELIN